VSKAVGQRKKSKTAGRPEYQGVVDSEHEQSPWKGLDAAGSDSQRMPRQAGGRWLGRPRLRVAVLMGVEQEAGPRG